ncbi:MAG: carbohydrate ABC transporter permease [Lentisphaerae bacterium]|nr:carbohydrate ABC transporter permease [Lentisphaerota bacterium]
MSLIPLVGRKSFSTRVLFAGLYLVLALGGFTMVYPFALMLATATTGNADWQSFRVFPRYWFDDTELLRKYVCDKAPLPSLAWEYRQDRWFTMQDVRAADLRAAAPSDPAARDAAAADWGAFLDTLPPAHRYLSFVHQGDREHSVLSLRPVFFRWLAERYTNDLEQANLRYRDTAANWIELGLPRAFAGGIELDPRAPRNRDWTAFVLTRPPTQTRVICLDEVAFMELRNRYGSAEGLNAEHGTAFQRLVDVSWNVLAGSEWGRRIQDNLLRTVWPLDQLRLRAAARPAFEAFAADRGVAFSTDPPADLQARAVWAQFVRTPECLLEFLEPVDPLQQWRTFLAGRYGRVDALNRAHGTSWATFDAVSVPAPAVDARAVAESRRSVRRTFLFGNFTIVFDYIFLHGRSLINTLILIALSIGSALTFNPMAAYVLSRFRLRHTHHILVFLLVTMAFPAEVGMIPGFLLIKSFPLGILAVGVAALLLYALVRLFVIRVRLPLALNALLALAVTAGAAWLLPPVIARALGRADLNVSLMNTFFALVLPGLASGYSIFLLKGFFDSLPPEIYEAAMLDGASEMRIFLRITMPLCKPVLAVIALGAFTGAYGQFMFAFLTCQDPRMWTLMVFLYQFQQMYSTPLIMAALVITSVPTLLVFLLCQNLILRGIVIPSYK